ncbi:MAG: hypothetical protein WDN00_10645 [Limisphaerales bacterium]
MHHEPLYVFTGCRHVIDGQEVVLIYTPYSHIPVSEQLHIEDILARLEKKQPVILVYVKGNETTLSVVMPETWTQKIESKALPGSLLKKFPIFEEDLPVKHPPNMLTGCKKHF